MKILALLFSLLTLGTLSLELLNESEQPVKVKSNNDNIELVITKTLPGELLLAENKWQNLIREKEDNDVEPSIANVELNNTLMVGGNNYELLGIFQSENSLFVLLKNENKDMLKLKLGDELLGEFTLTEISSNTIVFVNNNERLEYKLFEQNKHVKN
jgi:hypothetical protein